MGWGRVDGLGLKIFQEWIGHNGTDGRTHRCIVHLFIILTLEQEVGTLRQKLSSVMMGCMDRRYYDVVLCPTDYGDDGVHLNRCEKGLHTIRCNTLSFTSLMVLNWSTGV